MAEKTLQTRIINKHAELSAWNSSDLVLKEGEIALAKLQTVLPDGGTVDNYIAKIGTGKTFAESAWLYAKASDVYAWAKADKKPTYGAAEISYGSGSNVNEEITALKTAVGGSGTVANMITAAIEALDVEDAAVEKQFVTAVAEADGKISVTRRALSADDIPELAQSKITGLVDDLAAKAAKTYVDEQDNLIKARLDNGDIKQAIDAAKKAGDDAQDYAEGVAGDLADYETANNARVKAIEDDYTTAAEAGTIAEGKVNELANSQVKTNKENIAANAAAISALAGDGRTNETVKGNADAIAKLAQDIGNVANVMNFRGVSNGETAGADIPDPKAGDVIIFGEAEYVYDESGAWVKFGDASDNAQALTELGNRVTNVENDLKAGGATYQSIVAAKTAADTADDKAEAAQAKADANEAAIGVINGTGAGSIAKALADAKEYADAAESDAVKTANAYTDGEIDKVEESITNLTTTVGNNKTAAETATKKVADDLAAEITRAKAAEKAAQDAADAAQKTVDDLVATGQVNTNKQDITQLKTDVDTIEANYARVSDNKLVYGHGDAEMTIIFDCGGAE